MADVPSATPDGEVCPDYCTQVLFTEKQVQQRVRELARDINVFYEGRHVVLVGVLKGAFLFLSDLCRHLTVSHEVEFLAISSYGDSVVSSGNVRVNLDLRRDIKDKHVLVVEDIIDTGNTLHYLVEMLRGRNPASVEVCPFLRKKEASQLDPAAEAANPRFIGFDIPNAFVVGYGLDYAERYRTLKFIGILSPHIYETNKSPEQTA